MEFYTPSPQKRIDIITAGYNCNLLFAVVFLILQNAIQDIWVGIAQSNVAILITEDFVRNCASAKRSSVTSPMDAKHQTVHFNLFLCLDTHKLV